MLISVLLRVLRLVGLLRYRTEPPVPVRAPRPGEEPGASAPGLVDPAVRSQRRFGALIDQVDGTTCGSAVLLVLHAATDPALAARLSQETADGFERRLNEAQLRVQRQSNRWWPRTLGTTPWGMASWLRRHAPSAGPYRVRWVDAWNAGDVDQVLPQVTEALAAGHRVPLLIGSLAPRHWVLALPADAQPSGDDRPWPVYDPGRGEVRPIPLTAISQRALTPLLGYPNLHAVLLPHGAPHPAPHPA